MIPRVRPSFVVLNGEAATGKTTWARDHGYTIVESLEAVKELLDEGKDVALEIRMPGHLVYGIQFG